MRATAFAAWLLLVPGVVAQTQSAGAVTDIGGVWEAQLGGETHALLRFRISHTDNETLVGVFDAPFWNAKSIPLGNGRIEGDNVYFEVPDFGGRFSGRLNSVRDTLTGVWTQWESPVPLVLRRACAARSFPRPQDPAPPYPYLLEDLVLRNPETQQRIGGTLTLPAEGRFPLVILLSGAGPQNRENELHGHRMFSVLNDHLTRAGFATWCMDDRGVGASDGDFDAATVDDLVEDVRVVLKLLAERRDVDTRRVGIIAHGTGGWVAARAAAAERSIRALLLINTPMLAGDETEFTRMLEIAHFERGSIREPEWVDAEIELLRKASAVRDSYKGEPERVIVEHTRRLIETTVEQWSPAALQHLGDVREYASATAQRLNLPRVRDAWRFDPIGALGRVSCPVLAIMGGVDVEVPPSAHRPPLERLANTKRNISIREEMFWNHLLQQTRSRSASNYTEIDETIAPEALEIIRDWCAKHLK